MKRMIQLGILGLSVLCLNSTHAAAPKWDFDQAHSSFYFDIRHIYATVRGYFEDYTGTFLFAPDNLTESKFEIEIRVKSVNTNNRKRDNHLRSDDFFSAGKYPLMRFESIGIKHVGNDHYEVEGKLTIKDVSKDVVVPFRYFGARENPFEKDQLVAGFEAHFLIDRLDYNVGTGKYYKMGVTGKDADITVSLEMVRKK